MSQGGGAAKELRGKEEDEEMRGKEKRNMVYRLNRYFQNISRDSNKLVFGITP